MTPTIGDDVLPMRTRLPHHVRVGAKPAAPVAIADQNRRRSAGLVLVGA